MKRRILGFQRRVWWPKWTPASSSSLTPTSGKVLLPVFEVVAKTRHPVLADLHIGRQGAVRPAGTLDSAPSSVERKLRPGAAPSRTPPKGLTRQSGPHLGLRAALWSLSRA